MKDHSQENSMVLGAEYEESTERVEPDYDEVGQIKIDEEHARSVTDSVVDVVTDIAKGNTT